MASQLEEGPKMTYNQMRSRYAHELEVLLDDGEITEAEAQDMMEDWEYGYGDCMYDLQIDREFDND